MPKRVQKEKVKTEREQEPVQEMPAPEKTKEEKAAELDALLDEIDDLVEMQYAEETVRNFIQKGGE